MKAIYLRVSNEDLSYEDQLPEILNSFNLKKEDCMIFEEKVSAYKEQDQSKRSEFLRLKSEIEQGHITDVYVYSIERLERSIERMFEFYFFCQANDCKVHGALQPSLEIQFEDSPIGKFSKYLQVITFGLLGENESYMTSKRTKKAYNDGFSSYGKKWGDKFRDLEGFRVELPERTIKAIHRRVLFLASSGMIARDIIKDIEKKFKVTLSEMTISRIKRRNEK